MKWLAVLHRVALAVRDEFDDMATAEQFALLILRMAVSTYKRPRGTQFWTPVHRLCLIQDDLLIRELDSCTADNNSKSFSVDMFTSDSSQVLTVHLDTFPEDEDDAAAAYLALKLFDGRPHEAARVSVQGRADGRHDQAARRR